MSQDALTGKVVGQRRRNWLTMSLAAIEETFANYMLAPDGAAFTASIVGWMQSLKKVKRFAQTELAKRFFMRRG